SWLGGLDDPIPRTKTLAIGTWNVTSLGGKEPELSCGRLRAGRHVLEFTPCERERSLPCAFGLGIGLLLLFVHTGRTAVQSTRPSWSPWEGVLDIVLRLGTPLFYWGTSTLTWASGSDTWRGVIGRNGLPI
ncbi:hypothetical protein L3Q82_008769, partial [Scortum barcoo]